MITEPHLATLEGPSSSPELREVPPPSLVAGEACPARRGGWARLAAALVVALAAVLAYAGTLSFDFVWDDTLLIQRSHQLHYWRDLLPALTSHFWAEVQESSHYYRPLITLSFFFDLALWGLRPVGFHLTNLLAHLGVSLCVLFLARRLGGSDLAAGAAGLLFALHPLHTEPVAFISGRTDVFATLFYLLAILGYARWRQTGRATAGCASLASFFLALTAKEVAVTLPLVLVLYDWTQGPRSERPLVGIGRALGRYSLYGGVLALYGAIRVLALGGLADADGPVWAPLAVRVLTGLKILGWYAWLVVVPYPANAYYPIVPTVAPPPATWWLPVGFLVLVLGLTVAALRRGGPVAFGAVWFWVTVAPSAGVNFLPLSAPIMAERFLYLPSVGFCLLGGLAIRRLVGDLESGTGLGERQVRPGPALGLVAVLSAYALLTLWRNETWKDDYRLYLNMVETSPEAALPHVNLAFTQIQKGEVAAANEHLKRAVEILPQNPRALVGLALTETVLGDREAGLVNALKAYAYAPHNPNVLSTLGAVYLYRDDPARAVVHLEDSLALNPNQPNAVLNLALARSKLGQQAEAESALERGLALSALMTPDNAFAHRVAAEVHGDRDPARARAAWARYIAWLRSLPEPSDRQRADLAYSERQLARLSVEAPAVQR